jgi:hypothetical protein
MGNLGSLLSGGASSPLISTGTGLLSGLMGDSKMGLLSGALSSMLGGSKESSSSMLGLAAPMVMSMLAGAKKSEGLDTGGLLSALMGQKDLIAKAIPGDIGNALRGSGILDDVLGGAGAAASAAASSAADSVNTAAAAAKQSTPWLRYIVIALAALALLYFFLGSGQKDQTTGAGSAGTADFSAAGAGLTDGVANLVSSLNGTLGSITDPASARAAVGDLAQIGSQLDSLESTVASLPASSRNALAGAINTSLPALQRTADSLLADSAIGPIVQPTLDDIMMRLQRLAGN